jgi:hypothetical protein
MKNLQRTATTAQVLKRGTGTKSSGRNQVIDSGMSSFAGPLPFPWACIGSMRNWLQQKT